MDRPTSTSSDSPPGYVHPRRSRWSSATTSRHMARPTSRRREWTAPTRIRPKQATIGALSCVFVPSPCFGDNSFCAIGSPAPVASTTTICSSRRAASRSAACSTPGMRWHRTLSRLTNIRYRRPHAARHTSVSRDLTIGRSALWVARQHGHSNSTTLRFYAAWADGAPESDVERMRTTLDSGRPLGRALIGRRQKAGPVIVRPFEMKIRTDRHHSPARFATGDATGRGPSAAKSMNDLKKTGGRETSSSATRYLILNGYFCRRIEIPSHVPTEKRG